MSLKAGEYFIMVQLMGSAEDIVKSDSSVFCFPSILNNIWKAFDICCKNVVDSSLKNL